MNKLPHEILRLICNNFDDDKGTLKAVRLVNKNLAGAAAPRLFRRLLVYQTPKSWKRLSSIARCDWLARSVVRLEVAALDYLPHYLNFTDWKRSTWSFRWEDCCKQNNRASLVFLLLEKAETGPFKPLSYDPYMQFQNWKQDSEVRKWKKGNAAYLFSGYRDKVESPTTALESALGLRYRYEKYRYWHDGENDLLDSLHHSKNSQPLPDLVPFPNLRTVAVLGSRELWGDLAWPSAGANRKARETMIKTITEAAVEKMQRTVHLAMTLQMLDASGVNITQLELHRYRQLLPSIEFSISPLKNLQELVLNFPFSVNWEEMFDYQGRWELASWLRGADDLRTVIITSQDPDGHCWPRFFDIIDLFQGTEWPKLQCIHFTETFVRPKSLLRFLSEHKQSLESVRIEKPMGAWQSLASEFPAMELLSPGCVVEIDTPDFSDSDDAIPATYLATDSLWIDGNHLP